MGRVGQDKVACGKGGTGQGSMWEGWDRTRQHVGRVGQDKVACGKGGTGQGSMWEGWDRTR